MELLKCKDACSVVSADLDDNFGRWHLHDQVPVLGNNHELVQGRHAQDGVEGEVDLYDIEEDALCAVVLRHPECH
jgi:hypothetical protein